MPSDRSSIALEHPGGGDHLRECNHCGERFWTETHRLHCAPACPDCGRGGHGYHRISPATDPTHNTRGVEPEGDHDEMCARHWLLEGVRDGSCIECLGADLPAEMGAVVVTDDCGVTFAGDIGDAPSFAPSVLGPLSKLARAKDVSPGDILATFPPGDMESLELTVDIDRQQTLAEASA